MANLAFRSIAVLGILWGMVFGVAVVGLYLSDFGGPAAFGIGAAIAVVIAVLQYVISPFIIQWIYKIKWTTMDAVDPELASAVREECHKRAMKEPRFGIIEDGNPNAFTFGHYPGNARVVVTRGLVDLCDSQERKAVALHELGHIVHWDFVVMTIAATVPLILYMAYRFLLYGGRGRRNGGGAAMLVGIAALVFYWISQYIVLFLSRVREYYADQFAAQASNNPNAMANALVKIGYGLAKAQDAAAEEEEGGKRRATAQSMAASGGLKAMGIFDPAFGASMALAAAGTSSRIGEGHDAETTQKAMRWDIWNPWALVCELSSSHPLPAKRIRALDKMAERAGQKPVYALPDKPPESYWDEFFTDVLINYLPLLGLLVGAGVAVGLSMSLSGGGAALMAPIGAVVTGVALGSFLRVRFMYPKRHFPDNEISNLVGEVKVSKIRSIPATLRGKVIGRGIPGLYWSEDLVVQDESGFMVMDYRQPIGLLTFLFGLFRAESFVGQQVVATGWYRRFPRPYLELWQVRLPNGDVHTCHNWAVAHFGSLIFTVIGIGLFLLGLIGQMGVL